ncbi:MAG: dTMP kinase [Clostridia bacterium]|nr:dTMP kinase [Clostridia bacterium]MBR7141343.1 dTMP kinase [Clostridia bacterium]
MKGKFVTIEGCEGVGKSTLITLLKKYVQDNNIDAVFTREPGGTPVAEKIRAVILDADNKAMTDRAELLLYAAARAQHTQEKIIPAVSEGKIVFCDRYSDSTLAYQGYARGIDIQLCKSLNSIAECGVNIDLTIFLDLSPEDGFRRKGGADKGDRLENESLAFHKRVYEGFKDISKNSGGRYASIDASRSKEDVFESVIATLKERGIF